MTAHAAAPARTRIQDLCAAVLAGGDLEDLLTLLTVRARADLGAASSALVLPAGHGSWAVELTDGETGEALLGEEVPPDSGLGAALLMGDPDAVECADLSFLPPLAGTGTLTAPVDAGLDGIGALIVSFGDATALDGAAREHLNALATLIGLALREPVDPDSGVDDERGRIARDLHDLAIQELFAVGMELESLQRDLQEPGARGLDPSIARSVELSVQGVERAVAQIRQIVQSLRRDRREATLTERLRHESGLATAGLGFAPNLRLPTDPSRLDLEIPDEIAEDIVAVVREALANAARHAHASAVAISVTVFSEGVDRVAQVDVSDNGRGIDPTVTRRSGLANMSSRARRHQGWVDAIPLEPGTMISWRVTLPPM